MLWHHHVMSDKTSCNKKAPIKHATLWDLVQNIAQQQQNELSELLSAVPSSALQARDTMVACIRSKASVLSIHIVWPRAIFYSFWKPILEQWQHLTEGMLWRFSPTLFLRCRVPNLHFLDVYDILLIDYPDSSPRISVLLGTPICAGSNPNESRISHFKWRRCAMCRRRLKNLIRFTSMSKDQAQQR